MEIAAYMPGVFFSFSPPGSPLPPPPLSVEAQRNPDTIDLVSCRRLPTLPTYLGYLTYTLGRRRVRKYICKVM